MKKISLFLVYFISFMYMEFIYKIFIYKNIFRISIFNMILFLLCFSAILMVITTLFKKEKTNMIIYTIIMSIITIWFSAQYVVKSYFDFYISLQTFQIADQVANGFIGKAVIETIKRIPIIILFFLPLIITLLFHKRIHFKHHKPKRLIIIIIFIIISFSLYKLSFRIDKNKDFSSYHIYYDINDVSLTMENFGIINTLFIDIKKSLMGFEEKIQIVTPIDEQQEINKPEEIVYNSNKLDIDFEALSQNSSGNLKKIHDFMNNETGTLQNEYTGIFKNKNLILFMAESFNEVAVSKELTPTLYKLVNSGFIFKDFYTPTIYSTIGGEFQELTGLYAESVGTLSKFRSGNVSFPVGIGNVFKKLDYGVFAYHNNSYAFQDRNKYLKSLGFEKFKACYNGLEKLINCKEWPQSDVSMIENTFDDYINEEKFMVFYASVSGHSSYNWSSNAQAKKHKEEYLTHGYNYSEGPASYLAAQMELDKALELLIQKLEESGKLENTVIALVGDHYPYELTVKEVNEISSYEKDSVVEINHSNFILWNSEMDNVEVNKVGSQIDVIPTIYNVFGINYDSRLFMGKDILSTYPGLAIFGNRSWVTDKGTYYAAKREFVPKNKGEELEEDYVKRINQIVNNRIIMSKLIIENDYYKKVVKEGNE